MKLSKILLENSAMLPPSFDDLEIWMDFRKFLIAKFRIKDIVQHLAFEIITSIIIILSTINAVFYIYKTSPFVDFVDSFFIWLFLIELILRILAAGPEVFFSSKWNTLDAFLILFGIFFFFASNDNSDGIIRLWRIFRLDSVVDLFFSKFNEKKRKFQIYHKLKSIFAIIL